MRRMPHGNLIKI